MWQRAGKPRSYEGFRRGQRGGGAAEGWAGLGRKRAEKRPGRLTLVPRLILSARGGNRRFVRDKIRYFSLYLP